MWEFWVQKDFLNLGKRGILATQLNEAVSLNGTWNRGDCRSYYLGKMLPEWDGLMLNLKPLDM
jgi:hypothetical protein